MESKIKSITSALPDNMRKVEVLELEEGCTAGEAFNLMMNYPKLKAFKIAGVEYKRTQVGRLSSGDRLGGSSRAENTWDIDWLVHPAPPTRAPQTRAHFTGIRAENNRRRNLETAREYLERIAAMPPPVWYTDNTAHERTAAEREVQNYIAAAPTARNTHQTDEYRQLMERLMAENPAWRDFGDAPITPQRAETAGLADVQTAQPTPDQLRNLFIDPLPTFINPPPTGPISSDEEVTW